MPPVASPLYTEAASTHEGLLRRFKDLSDYQIPRLRDCVGPLTLQQQYAAELREDVDALSKRLEDFGTLAEDQEREHERVQVRAWVSELYDELTRLKAESRAALLTSKRTIDSNAHSRRNELLGPAALSEKRSADADTRRQQVTDDTLMAASDNVTEALRRTTRLMQQELERSVLSSQMLDESSRTLRATSDSYTSIDGLMDTSQALIKALQRADWVDRLIIGLALAVFILTSAYIIKRRVLDRVISVVTLPMRVMGTTSASSLVSTASSVASAASSAVSTASSVATSLASSIVTSSTESSSSTLSAATGAELTSATETALSTACSSSPCTTLTDSSEIVSILSDLLSETATSIATSVISATGTPLAGTVHEEL